MNRFARPTSKCHSSKNRAHNPAKNTTSHPLTKTHHSYPAIMSAIKSSSLPKTFFLVFYSSIVDGKMWCPDCVDVEPSVREAFDGAEKPEAQLFYVGKKEEWRPCIQPRRP